jgi:hypothetical protein
MQNDIEDYCSVIKLISAIGRVGHTLMLQTSEHLGQNSHLG